MIYFETRYTADEEFTSLGKIKKKPYTTFSVSSIFKIIAWLNNLLTIVAFAVVVKGGEDNFPAAAWIFVSVVILGWIYMLFFGQLFKGAGKFVVIVMQILVKDVIRYTFVWTMILAG